MSLSPEQLITELTLENKKLKEELEQAKKDIKDFEVLAIEWKLGYSKMERNLEIKIKHLEQTLEEYKEEIEFLEEDIKNLID